MTRLSAVWREYETVRHDLIYKLRADDGMKRISGGHTLTELNGETFSDLH
jgi:hypothetical protein